MKSNYKLLTVLLLPLLLTNICICQKNHIDMCNCGLTLLNNDEIYDTTLWLNETNYFDTIKMRCMCNEIGLQSCKLLRGKIKWVEGEGDFRFNKGGIIPTIFNQQLYDIAQSYNFKVFEIFSILVENEHGRKYICEETLYIYYKALSQSLSDESLHIKRRRSFYWFKRKKFHR